MIWKQNGRNGHAGSDISEGFKQNLEQALDKQDALKKRIDTLVLARKNKSEEEQGEIKSLIAECTAKYKAESSELEADVKTRKIDLRRCYQSLNALCAKIPVEFHPGVTTYEDIVAVTELSPAEAAKLLKLFFGVQMAYDAKTKKILTFFCFCFESIALMLLNPNIDVSNLLATPFLAGASIIGGAVITLTSGISIYNAFEGLGGRIGNRKLNEAVPPIAPILVPLLILWAFWTICLACLDGFALVRMNSPMASISSAYAIPLTAAIPIGCILSGGYVSAMALTAIASSYNPAAKESISTLIKSDADKKRAALIATRPILFEAVIRAFNHSKTLETQLESDEAELQAMENAYKDKYKEYKNAMPPPVEGPTIDEKEQLDKLSQEAAFLRIHVDSYNDKDGDNS